MPSRRDLDEYGDRDDWVRVELVEVDERPVSRIALFVLLGALAVLGGVLIWATT